jgi:hypothetical protein
LRGPLLKSSFAIQCHQGWIQRCFFSKQTGESVQSLTLCYGLIMRFIIL